MHRHKIAVMATGGMDSTTLIYTVAGWEPQIITVDYGQTVFHIQQELLTYHIDKLGLSPLVVIPVQFPTWQRQPGLFTPEFTPTEVSPLEDWDKLRYENFFIEGRNLIMVGYTLAYCSVNKIDELLTGYLYHETEWDKLRTYKLMTGDNSPHFVDTMNLVSRFGFSHQVRLRAPFYEQRLSKMDVAFMGQELGVEFDRTYSCYFEPICGKCDNCLLRKEIMEALNG